jgi:hypothetical protein
MWEPFKFPLHLVGPLRIDNIIAKSNINMHCTILNWQGQGHEHGHGQEQGHGQDKDTSMEKDKNTDMDMDTELEYFC